ncbi:fibrous sheath CABYR-binding protein-like isoform X2 [Gallus gallus]|uniref:fibrous sheath CABYR-binding protein-like isoform X1 n=1 Tax=Gallus gallus TaxID=9031 RepID=UPI001AE1BE43|nr:fibrous sheath CABYR-binding protein-like isoform X1 [Gallus gallus]XP_040541242.1 fibrous sheath CABYR-binding protein-like isoform X2 [Gallus gallus]
MSWAQLGLSGPSRVPVQKEISEIKAVSGRVRPALSKSREVPAERALGTSASSETAVMSQQGDDCNSYFCPVSGEQGGAVPCVWEQQPAGCQRSNCAFQRTEGRDGDGPSLLPCERTEPARPQNGAGQRGKRKASAEADASGLPAKRSHAEGQERSAECGTTPKRAVATSLDVPEDTADIQGLLSWISDVARAVEVPHEHRSSPAPGCFIAELPDYPRDSRELSTDTQAVAGTPTDPFWGLPPSPGLLSELQCGLSPLHPVVPPESVWLSPRLTPLAVTTPPSAQTTEPVEEVQQRQPQGLQAQSPPSLSSVSCPVAEKKSRGSTKRTKRPAPAGTTRKRESSQQEQPTSGAPAKKRKLPQHKKTTERRGRHPQQVKPSGASAGASSRVRAGAASELYMRLCASIQAVHPLGQRVTAVGPVRQPPSVQPQPTPSAGPAALQPQHSATNKAAPAPPRTTAREEDAAKKMAPSCLRPSLQRSSTLWRHPPSSSQLHHRQPRPQHPLHFGPRRGGRATVPRVMEKSRPITAEQRPKREHMKKLAQEERQRAAHQMKIGPVQFLVQREIDMAVADDYGYL